VISTMTVLSFMFDFTRMNNVFLQERGHKNGHISAHATHIRLIFLMGIIISYWKNNNKILT
jgi:hypothetical protein